MKKTLTIAVILGLLAGVGGRFILHGSPAGASANPSAQPEALAVTASNGIIEGVRPEAALRSEAVGSIARVLVHENDVVEKGALLAELNNETQKAQVALAEAELAVAREQYKKLEAGERVQVRNRAKAEERARAAAYERAKRDWDRAASAGSGLSAGDRDAYRNQLNLTLGDWDKAKAELAQIEEGTRAEDLEMARRQVEAAEAKVHVAQAELAKTRMTAPAAGKVLQILAEPGETAGPNAAQPILILADVSRRRVRAFVEEIDVGRVQPGQPAVVTADGLKGREFTGHVATVLDRMGKRGPESDSPGEYKDIYFREVLIDLDDAGELPTHLRVQVRMFAK